MASATPSLKTETALFPFQDPFKKALRGVTAALAGLRLTPLPHAGAAKEAAGTAIDFTLKSTAYGSATHTSGAARASLPALDFSSFAPLAGSFAAFGRASEKRTVAELRQERANVQQACEFYKQMHTTQAAASVLKAPFAAKDALVHKVRETNDHTRLMFAMVDAGVANWCRTFGVDKVFSTMQRWLSSQSNREKATDAIASYYGVQKDEAHAYLKASGEALRYSMQTAATAYAGTAATSHAMKQIRKLTQLQGATQKAVQTAPATLRAIREGEILSHSEIVLYQQHRQAVYADIRIECGHARVELDAVSNSLPGVNYFRSALRAVQDVAYSHGANRLFVTSQMENPRLLRIMEQRYGLKVMGVPNDFLGHSLFDVPLPPHWASNVTSISGRVTHVADIAHVASYKFGMHKSTGTMLVQLESMNTGSRPLDIALEVFKTIHAQAKQRGAKQVVLYTNEAGFRDMELSKYLQLLPEAPAPFGQKGYLLSADKCEEVARLFPLKK